MTITMWGRLVGVLVFCMVCSSVFAQNPNRAGPRQAQRIVYTGIEGAMPRGAHMAWLRHNAAKQRRQGDMDEKDKNPMYKFGENGAAVGARVAGIGSRGAPAIGECTVAIGNEFVTNGSPRGATGGNTVIIDGDIINAGRCD